MSTFRHILFCGSQQQAAAGWYNLILTVPRQFHYRPLAYLSADDYVDTTSICEMRLLQLPASLPPSRNEEKRRPRSLLLNFMRRLLIVASLQFKSGEPNHKAS